MFCAKSQTSIESGYLILTMMPSLFCPEKCPHCYLSKEQRSDKTTLSIDSIHLICEKIKNYYLNKNIQYKSIVLYWYGGEPTSMGMDYFRSAIEVINATFDSAAGYIVKHVVLTSLVNVGDEWFDFFREFCGGYFQTSYDGRMRGKKYLEAWESRVRDAVGAGLDVGTLSVVNEDMLGVGGSGTVDYLAELGVSEAGFLPFMLNAQNKGKKYNRFAPTMRNWSKFLIDATRQSRSLFDAGLASPRVGQEMFHIAQQSRGSSVSNIAAQTLFLMPDGVVALPDYKNRFEEYLRPFGNLLESSFEQVLNGDERLDYLTKQITRNMNYECLTCEYSNSCVMEFWKENRLDDDCYGGKIYLEWLGKHPHSRHGDPSKIFIC